MGTPLQDVYDAFFVKSIKDYTDKESLVFQFFKTAISKSYKTIPTDLTYTADIDYSGNFVEILNQDDIELIALNMLLEEKIRDVSRLENNKQHIGTKDFNRLPDKASEYKIQNQSMKDLEDKIFKFRQEFYSYGN